MTSPLINQPHPALPDQLRMRSRDLELLASREKRQAMAWVGAGRVKSRLEKHSAKGAPFLLACPPFPTSCQGLVWPLMGSS